MARLIIFLILVFCIFLLWRTPLKKIFDFRRKGFLPANGEKPTLFDVKQLIIMGEVDAAVWLYCDIYKVGRKQAAKEIQQLSESIRQKNSDKD